MKVQTKEELEVWFEGRSREITVGVAMRAALRVLPLLAIDVRDEAPAALVLPCFRAAAAGWVAGAWPNQTQKTSSKEFAISYAAAGAFYAADNSTHSDVTSSVALALNCAASAACSTAFSGTVAAAAVAHAAAATANDKIWQEASDDLFRVDRGTGFRVLFADSIWPSSMPADLHELWLNLSQRLLKIDPNWAVWTDWYQDRLAGELGRTLIARLEVDRVLVPAEADWQKGHFHVNAILAGLERKYRGDIEAPSREQEDDLVPEQRPAVIEVELGDDGLLHRKPVVSPEVRDEDQRARLEAAWRAHLDTVKRLLALNPQGRGLEGLLDAYRAALGESFDGLRVIDLGIYGLSLQEMAERADEVLIGGGAALLKAVGTSHGMFIRQLPAWRAYLDDAEPEPPQEAVQDAVRILRMTGQFTQVMGEDVIVAANTLADLTLPLMADPAQRASLPLSREAVSSTENLLSGLLEPAYRAAKAVGTVAGEEALKGFGIGVRTITAAVTIGTSAEVLGLAEKMPGTFGWVKQVVATIKGALK